MLVEDPYVSRCDGRGRRRGGSHELGLSGRPGVGHRHQDPRYLPADPAARRHGVGPPPRCGRLRLRRALDARPLQLRHPPRARPQPGCAVLQDPGARDRAAADRRHCHARQAAGKAPSGADHRRRRPGRERRHRRGPRAGRGTRARHPRRPRAARGRRAGSVARHLPALAARRQRHAGGLQHDPGLPSRRGPHAAGRARDVHRLRARDADRRHYRAGRRRPARDPRCHERQLHPRHHRGLHLLRRRHGELPGQGRRPC